MEMAYEPQVSETNVSICLQTDAISNLDSRLHSHILNLPALYLSVTVCDDILRYCMVFGPFTGKDNLGCPVTFGVGFMSNEGADAFSWLLSEFVYCMGFAPKDFPMGSLLKTTSFSESENSFFKRYTKPYFNLADFVMHYNSALDAQRNITERFDFSDASKVPILSTEHLFEKHAAAMYTDRIFQQVQDEIIEADRRCRMSHFEMGDNTEIYTIMDNHRNKGVVRHEIGTESYHCDCKLFLWRGISCSHIFWLFKNHDVKEIQGTYIGTRWLKTPLLKSVHNDQSEEASTSADSQVDDKRVVATKLHSLYFRLFQRAQSNVNDIFALFYGMEELSHKLFGDTVPSVSSMSKA
ncbi:hypothetical protein SASPL_137872 [Salvia splendens]|uniref:SWIM-type domain-containing protein n=1 Tax=Salvia splendens TaxID=180675 RepID=A0A8X8ZDT2_SALSN|nr:hypothetical protein SASPL_137872 [Salvia splendens]